MSEDPARVEGSSPARAGEVARQRVHPSIVPGSRPTRKRSTWLCNLHSATCCQKDNCCEIPFEPVKSRPDSSKVRALPG
jgi:hypothetical protein